MVDDEGEECGFVFARLCGDGGSVEASDATDELRAMGDGDGAGSGGDADGGGVRSLLLRPLMVTTLDMRMIGLAASYSSSSRCFNTASRQSTYGLMVQVPTRLQSVQMVVRKLRLEEHLEQVDVSGSRADFDTNKSEGAP